MSVLGLPLGWNRPGSGWWRKPIATLPISSDLRRWCFQRRFVTEPHRCIAFSCPEETPFAWLAKDAEVLRAFWIRFYKNLRSTNNQDSIKYQSVTSNTPSQDSWSETVRSAAQQAFWDPASLFKDHKRLCARAWRFTRKHKNLWAPVDAVSPIKSTRFWLPESHRTPTGPLLLYVGFKCFLFSIIPGDQFVCFDWYYWAGLWGDIS